MRWIRENLIENPVMAEIGRVQQVLKGRGRGAMGLRTAIIVAVIIAGVILWTVTFSVHVEPSVSFYAQFIFTTVAIPLLFYGSIAGEREKRSWDLLRVTPVTGLQIVIGKFAAMAAFAVVVHLIFLAPFLFSLLNKENYPDEYYSSYSSGLSESVHSYFSDFPLLRLGAGETYSLLLSFFVAALTLFFSARSKRSYTALALTFGTLVILFVFIPMFTADIGRQLEISHFLNPLMSMGYLGQSRYYAGQEAFGSENAVFWSMFFVAFVAVSLVVYASYTLAFADNLVKFIKKREKRHA